ncbi:MAG: DUF2892 domain-containing protein [Bacteroidales bacterium]|nr:DUF2892 domain-containing protein [Bacteroidales bacterium]MCF8333782.1 DUF2892 domain-containing protein [Bacteroidales bacterium]
MTKNVGTTDKVIRVVIAAVAAGLIITKTLTGVWAIVAGIVGAAMLITSVAGFCGLYKLFGMSTCPTNTDKTSGS